MQFKSAAALENYHLWRREYNRIDIYKPWNFTSVIISKTKLLSPQSVPPAAKHFLTCIGH